MPLFQSVSRVSLLCPKKLPLLFSLIVLLPAIPTGNLYPSPPIHQTPRPIRTLLSRNSLLLPFILPLIQTQPKISNHDLINLKLGLIKLNQSQIGRLDALRQLPYPKQEFLKSIFQMKFLKGVNPFTRTSSLALFSQRCPLIKPLRMSSTFFGVKELSWRYTPILLNAQ